MFLQFPVNSTISHRRDLSLPLPSIPCHKAQRRNRAMAAWGGEQQIGTRAELCVGGRARDREREGAVEVEATLLSRVQWRGAGGGMRGATYPLTLGC